MKPLFLSAIALVFFTFSRAQVQSGAWSGYTEYSRLSSGSTNIFKLEYAVKKDQTLSVKWRFTNYLDVTLEGVKIAARNYTLESGSKGQLKERSSEALILGRFRPGGGFRTHVDQFSDGAFKNVQLEDPEVYVRLKPLGPWIRWNDHEKAVNEIRQQKALALQQQREREEAARNAERQRQQEIARQQAAYANNTPNNNATGNGSASGKFIGTRPAGKQVLQSNQPTSPGEGGQPAIRNVSAQSQPSINQQERQVNDATFEEAIDFAHRFMSKEFYLRRASTRDYDRIDDITLRVKDKKSFTVEVIEKGVRFKRNGDLLEKTEYTDSYTLTMKDIGKVSISPTGKEEYANWQIGIACKNFGSDCITKNESYKYYINGSLEDTWRDSEKASSYDHFRASDQETAERIKTALLHAVKLAGKEKF